MRSHSLVALFFVLLASPSFTQHDGDQPAWSPKKLRHRPALTPKGSAKTIIKAFKVQFRALKDQDDKLKAINGLIGQARSPVFVKPLAKILLKEKSIRVRMAAADGLALIGDAKAETSLIKAICHSQNADEMDLLVSVGRALGICQKKSRFKKLENDFQRGNAHVKRALVLSWGFAKDWQALKLLSSWLERPSPANPSAASNPPASYWRARHAEWRQIKRQVEWAAWAITGRVFYSNQELKDFLRKNPKPPKKKKSKKKK